MGVVSTRVGCGVGCYVRDVDLHTHLMRCRWGVVVWRQGVGIGSGRSKA